MAYNASQDPTEDIRERMYLPELLRGLAITTSRFFRNLFGSRDANVSVVDRKGTSLISTVQYPEEKIPYPPGYRGTHRLVPREDGKPRCVACYMCATICPAQCIYIEAGEYDPAEEAAESRVIEKFPTAFVIDELRCIVCGFCVDACPKDAIRMDRSSYVTVPTEVALGKGGPNYDPAAGHTPSAYTRKDFVYDIPRLLGGPAVTHESDPWYKREGSAPPRHAHKEAHTRIGEGLLQLKGHHQLQSHNKIEIDTHNPVPVTKFLK
jgi:NADH-quinone oxidoreductase subunit I